MNRTLLTTAQRLQLDCSVFPNARSATPQTVQKISEILTDIQTGRYRRDIEPLRAVYAEYGKSKAYSDSKKNLSAVTFCGTFTPTRAKANLLNHTGFVIADIDGVGDVQALKATLCSDPFVTVCFVSPSGDGLKLLIAIPFVKRDNEYKLFLPAIRDHFIQSCNVDLQFQREGADVSRLCFVSYDPEIYVNETAQIFAEIADAPDPEPPATYHRPAQAHTPASNDRQAKIKENAKQRILDIIYNSAPGDRHHSRLIAAKLAGGYIAGGVLAEADILPDLETAVRGNTEDFKTAWKTIFDGIEYGATEPISYEMKEREYREWLLQKQSTNGNGNGRNGSHTPPPNGHPQTGQPRTKYELTELGNSRRFIDRFEPQIRFNHTANKWHIWDGTRWAPDLTNQIPEMAKELSRMILADAINEPDEEKRKPIIRHALRSESQKTIVNSLKLASTDQRIAIRTEQLDQNQYLFNVANGTVELNRDGYKFREHCQQDNISKIANVTYDPAATAPRWRQFLNEVFVTQSKSDGELIRFIQSAIGLALTGDTSEQYLFFCYGLGKNGKSTFFETLRHLFGDYYQKAPADMLMAKKGGQGIPADIARLVGTRFVVASEIESGRYLAESIIKDLTGGDRITARFMRENFFEFDPTHKMWIYGNHRPQVRGIDEGIWRRLLVIPFTQTFASPDKGLKDKLIAELPGIFNWALEGYNHWRKNGLQIPDSVLLESKAYRESQDNVRAFLEACCEFGSANRVTYRKLYEGYQKWADEEGERAFRKKDFKARLIDQGLPEPQPGTGNKPTVFGVCLSENARKWLFPNENELDF